jgi:hypothetical protein
MEQEKCWMDSEVHQCCCTCKYHWADYEHCSVNRELRNETMKCICSIQKGWICVGQRATGSDHVYSNWPEHSIGCELWEDKI